MLHLGQWPAASIDLDQAFTIEPLAPANCLSALTTIPVLMLASPGEMYGGTFPK
jgi:hypothetical protein